MVTKNDPAADDSGKSTGASAASPTENATETASDDTSAAPETAIDVSAVSRTLIRYHVLASAAAGAIPVAFLDSAALAAVQLNMLRDLSKTYQVEFRGDIGKSAIGTLLATVTPVALTNTVLGSGAVRAALRSIPFVGPAVGLLTMPAFNAATTYALGRVFNQHFASGGTFLTFDPDKVKEFFKTEFNKMRGKTPEQTAEQAAA